MASLREAMKRLQVIYEDCAPDAAEAAATEKGLDEFSRLKKKVHKDVKGARVVMWALKYDKRRSKKEKKWFQGMEIQLRQLRQLTEYECSFAPLRKISGEWTN